MVRCGAGGIAGILPAIPLPVAPHRVDQKEGGVAAAPIAPMRRHAPALAPQEERRARRAFAHDRARAPIAHRQVPSAHLHRGAVPAAALSQLSGRVARAAWRRLRRASGGGRSSSTRLQVVRSGRCVHRSTVSSCPSPSPRSSCARRPAASNAARRQRIWSSATGPSVRGSAALGTALGGNAGARRSGSARLEPCQRGTRAARCTKNCFDTPMPVMVPQDESARYREAIGTAREGAGVENSSPVRDRWAEPERNPRGAPLLRPPPKRRR
jgi:hypothetical protein